MDVEIKRADLADIQEILSLQYEAYQSEALLYNDFTIQPLTQTIEQIEDEYKRCVFLKAVSDGKIVGSVRAYEEHSTVYVGKLIVLPAYQNKGIGKRLLQAVENEFNAGRYELFTGAKSIKNIAVYEKAGYAKYKEENTSSGLTFVYMEKQAKAIKNIGEV